MSDAPHIVAANKQDVEGCLTPEIIRIMMKIPSSIPVVPLVATDPESVRKALITLVKYMITWYSSKQEAKVRGRYVL